MCHAGDMVDQEEVASSQSVRRSTRTSWGPPRFTEEDEDSRVVGSQVPTREDPCQGVGQNDSANLVEEVIEDQERVHTIQEGDVNVADEQVP